METSPFASLFLIPPGKTFRPPIPHEQSAPKRNGHLVIWTYLPPLALCPSYCVYYVGFSHA